jgi:hypothetical protein
VAAPSFHTIQDAIRSRLFNQFPNIPDRYITEMNKVLGKSSQPKAAATIPSPSDSNPRAPTPRAPRTTPPGLDPDSTKVCANPADIVTAWTQSFAASSKTIRMLRATPLAQQPTSSDPNVKICISWQVKGFCYSKCMNCATHRVLDATETAAFQAFLTANL